MASEIIFIVEEAPEGGEDRVRVRVPDGRARLVDDRVPGEQDPPRPVLDLGVGLDTPRAQLSPVLDHDAGSPGHPLGETAELFL